MKHKHNLESYRNSARELNVSRNELGVQRQQLERTKELSRFIREMSQIQDEEDIQVANNLDMTMDEFVKENCTEVQINNEKISECVIKLKDYLLLLKRNIEKTKAIPEGYGNEKQKYIESARERCNQIEEIISDLTEKLDGLHAEELNQIKEVVNECKNMETTLFVEEILIKDSFDANDRKDIRAAICQGKIGEKEIRCIGSKVRETYNAAITERNNEFEAIQSKRRELAIQSHRNLTAEERQKNQEQFSQLMQREIQYREKYAKTNLMKEVLGKYREMGPGNDDKGQAYAEGLLTSQTVINTINSIREYLPTEWLEKSSEIPINTRYVLRGYFTMSDGKPTIALSNAKGDMQICAFHEMGHFYEELYPEIRKLEHQFYNRRTAGEDLKWLGPRYSKSEVTRFDNFIDPYMGKDYGNTETSGYEILSMGMESIFKGSYNLSRDPEYQDFILGILASI